MPCGKELYDPATTLFNTTFCLTHKGVNLFVSNHGGNKIKETYGKINAYSRALEPLQNLTSQ